MRRILTFVAVPIVAIAATALAQVQTGSILVRAIDEQGGMVPGATVAISSAILPQEIVGTTRTWAIQSGSATVVANCVRQASITVNAEPRGSVLLPWLHTLDLRGGRRFKFGGGQEFDLSLDVYNVTNANTTFDVRRTTSLTNIRPAGDLAAPVQQISSFLSPTNVLAPRVARVNVTYRFGGR